ncbi:MAG: LysM peptidoglycan-binding domain-containing protein, partial [Treponema sp.]|nr:LysM peptidoglycan-binding domain-containing protein [Treponema sp.]
MAAAVLEQDMGSEASLELYYQTYRVKPGDMIGFIAQEFNVTSDTIVSVNSIKAARNILPGQFLKIPSMPGILYTVRTGSETIETIADKYEVSAEKCARVNSIDRNAKL